MKTEPAREHYILRLEKLLAVIVQDSDIPASRLRQAMHYVLFPGGKRIRPVLVYLSGELLNVHPDCLDAIAASIEITHCYSLVHDDLPAMDDDDFRRGKPSCHRAFDEATAILLGDGMQALAIETLLNQLSPHLPAGQVIAICKELVKASGMSGMVSGQSLDLSELSKPAISENRLAQIHALKTGRLISACINMVLLAKTTLTEAQAQSLKDFGNILGLVFQMQDDYLDLYASSEVLGKGRASDLANEKTTFASLYSKPELAQKIREHYQRARQALHPFGEKAKGLYDLIDNLEGRNDSA